MIDLAASIDALEQIHFSGPGMHKIPSDVKRYEKVIERVQPRLVIETGLYYGGSARFFSELVDRVVTVEIDHDRVVEASRYGMFNRNVSIVEGDSCDSAIVEKMHMYAEHWSRKGAVMVSLDSDHSAATVLAEMEAYGPLVTPGAYMVVEDGILGLWEDNWFDGSPLDAIAAYLERHGDEWEVDREVEDMFPTTLYPDGWLRRRG